MGGWSQGDFLPALIGAVGVWDWVQEKQQKKKKEEAEGLMAVTTSTRVLLTEWRESNGG